MERDYSAFIPLQQDEIPINFPDSSIYDVVGFYQDCEKNNSISHDLEKSADAKINEELEKKKVHREIERERRKEMAALYASLRSVLPSNSIKGMRSASDQIDGATKYIRYIKKSREKGKLGFLRENKWSSSKNLVPFTVTVQRFTVGVEVLISCGCINVSIGLSLRLSGILQLLLEEGLGVVDCNCTNFDGSLHYKIRSEVLTCPSIDLQMLQGS